MAMRHKRAADLVETSELTRLGRVLVAFLPPIAVLNPILPHIGPVASFTAYSVLFFAYGVFHLRRRPPSGIRRLVLVLCLPVLAIALWTVITQFGTPVVFTEAVVVAGGIFIVLGLIALPSSRDTMRAILAGWLLASLATTVLAAIELTTGRHFGPNYLDANPTATKTGVVTVFFNPNNYAAFLCLAIPLLLAGATLTTRRWLRLTYYATAVVSVPLTVATSSRFGLAALVLGGSIWLMLRLRSHIAQAFMLAFALFAVILTLTLLQGRAAGDISSAARSSGYVISVMGLDIPSDSSLLARWNLMLNGLDMIPHTPFGSGPGGYELAAQAQGTTRNTFGMINPHNGAIEFITQYGIILGAIAALLTITLFIVSVRANNTYGKGTPERALASATVCVIAMLPLILGMHSTFLDVPHEWIGFATFAAVGAYLQARRATIAVPDGSTNV
ncbi:MAG: O-antigen ligase family protein [Microbacterium sp.]|nr:O-antigen ligase family protein [Microbacterium sp.]